MTKDNDDPLRPKPPGGLGRGAMLAILVHLGLIGAIAIGVNWRSREPEGMEAELWAAVPERAAPKPQEAPPPPPPPPAPAPTPAPPPPPAPAPEPPKPDPQIAIEKARKEKEEKDRLERERVAKLERERAERERQEREMREREKAEAERKKVEQAKAEAKRKQELEAQRKKVAEEKRLAELLEKQREDQIKRIQGLAGATGAPSSTGTAQRDAGPSSGYAGRIKARIKPNIVFIDDVPGNPVAEVEVRAAPDGTIVGRRVIKSSGNREWDEAVLRAIDRTEVLPRDIDGSVPSPMVIAFRPRD